MVGFVGVGSRFAKVASVIKASGALLLVGAAAVAAAQSSAPSAAPVKPAAKPVRPLTLPVPPEVREVHADAVRGDAEGLPFAIVDKRGARLLVFHADGRLAGAAPALVGLARGDLPAVPLGRRAPSQLALEERTTPAGRYASEPGINLRGEAIVWFDYDAALAIHRLRPAPAAERRPQRLASPSPDDNRISLGCVVVEPAFYDAVVAPTLGTRRGIVYVLPERGSLRTHLAAAAAHGSAP